jgi:ABC-type multidrug transport system fused ATPase/permease subunit
MDDGHETMETGTPLEAQPSQTQPPSLNHPSQATKSPRVHEGNANLAWEERASWWSRLTLAWMEPMLQHAKGDQSLHAPDISPLPRWYRSRLEYEAYGRRWKRLKDKHSLAYILTRIYWAPFCLAGVVLLAGEMAHVMTPVVLMYLFKEMEGEGMGGGQRWAVGLTLCLLIFGLQCLGVLCGNLFYRRIQVLGMRVRTALTMHIADKCLSIDPQHVASPHPHNNSAHPSAAVNNATPSVTHKGGRLSILLTRDAYAVDWMLPYVHMWWSIPTVCAVISAMLFDVFGWTGLAGCLMLFMTLPLLIALVPPMRSLRQRASDVSDLRLDRLGEILRGLRTIKLHVWEHFFGRDMDAKRERELLLLWRLQLLRQFANALASMLPLYGQLGTFCLYVFVEHHRLHPAQAIIGLTLFNLLRQPVALAPIAMNATAEGMAALRRMEDFLRAPDAVDLCSRRQFHRHIRCRLRNVLMARPPSPNDGPSQASNGDNVRGPNNTREQNNIGGSQSNTHTAGGWRLRVGEFQVEPGQLVCIIGANGVGKSSFLHGLLGFLDIQPYTTATEGAEKTVAEEEDAVLPEHTSYAPQVPWIMKKTVRENVLFYNPYDRRLYQRVLQECQLQEDLRRFPKDDLTVVDEGSLSGGQRQRLGLARALYHAYLHHPSINHPSIHSIDEDKADNGMTEGDKDDNVIIEEKDAGEEKGDGAVVVVLDDPVSALDKRVSRRVLQQAIIDNRQLTRVVVTQHPRLLEAADVVYAIEPLSNADHNDGDVTTTTIMTLRRVEDVGSVLSSLSSPRSPQLWSPEQPSCPDEIIVDDDSDLEVEEGEAAKGGEGMAGGPVAVEDEYRGRGAIHREVLRDGLRFGGGWWILVPGLLFMAIQQAFRTLYDFYANVWARSRRSDGVGSPYFFANLLAAFAFGNGMSMYAASWFLVLFTVRLARRIHQMSLNGILRAPYPLVSALNVGAVINRFSFDQDVVDYGLSENVRIVAQMFVNMLAVVAVLVTASGLYFIPVGLFGFGLYWSLRKYRPSARELARLTCQTRAPLAAHLSRALHGQSVIRAFGKQPAVQQESGELLDGQNQPYYSIVLLPRWLELRVSLLGNVVILCAALGYFFSSINRASHGGRGGVMSESLQAVSLIKALTVSRVLYWLMRRLTDLEMQLVSVERILHYAKLPPEEGAENTESAENADRDDGERGLLDIPQGHVQFRHVTVTYPVHAHAHAHRQALADGKPLTLDREVIVALQDVCLDFPPRTHTVVIGRTGSGKSTLLLALFRLVPLDQHHDQNHVNDQHQHHDHKQIQSHEPEPKGIFIDGTNIQEFNLQRYRRSLAIVPQEPFVFRGTLRQNLDPLQNYVDADLWLALQAVSLRDNVPRDAGLEWTGAGFLSAGQQQLLCLARALLGDRRILVLDEATSSLDGPTALVMQRVIRDAALHRTVISVAHRHVHSPIADGTAITMASGDLLVDSTRSSSTSSLTHDSTRGSTHDSTVAAPLSADDSVDAVVRMDRGRVVGQAPVPFKATIIGPQ